MGPVFCIFNRGTAFSTAGTCGLIASVITPYALYLQYYVSWLPGVSISMHEYKANFLVGYNTALHLFRHGWAF